MTFLKRYGLLALLVLAVVAVFASGAPRYLNLDALLTHEAALRGYIEANLPLALLVFIFVYAVATAVSFPGAVILTLAGGYLFGTWVGGTATVIGATLGSIAVFYVVQTSLGRALRTRAEADGGMLKKVIDGVREGAFGYILTLRLLPIAPFWLVNVAAALANAPLRAYALATLFGIMPATFIYSGVGAGIDVLIARGESPDLGVIFDPNVLLPLVALGLLSLATTVFQRLRAKSGKSFTQKLTKADLVVIGAGSGGLSVAAGAAQLGLKVVLFEKGEMGGDCLNYGCVPSKALIAAAAAAHEARHAERLGVATGPVEVDFARVMDRVQAAIATIAPNDSQARFEGLGVRVVREAARFENARTVASDSVRVRARKIVVATGSRAVIPPIEGLQDVPYLTNETVFAMTERPDKLIILGGGPIGVELGQAFRRLGSEVVIVEAGELLGREDRAAAEVVLEQLRRDGVEVLAGHRAVRVDPGPMLTLSLQKGDREVRITGTHLLVAVGRRPSIDGLGLDKAAVDTDRNGIITDRSLRSSNKKVYAVGDAAGRGQFTHLAGAHAALVVRRAVFGLPVNADALQVPRVTYCDPEVASIGLGEAEAREAHSDDLRVEVFPFAENDRAIAEDDTRGFGKLITTRKGKVLGVTLVGRHAGDHIPLWSLVMSAGLKLSQITSMVAPYPTRGEINKRLAGQWYTQALFSGRTRALVSILKRFA